MVKPLLCIIILFTCANAYMAEPARLLRFPAIYGENIVFSSGGDLYSVNADGGLARKLTSDKGYESFPRFSPDGKHIAFTGQYDGNTEVYLMESNGGVPKRLTYTALLDRDDISDRMGPNNIVMTWTPDGKNITYRSRKKSFNDFKGMLYNVSVEGGLSSELPFSVAGFCSYSPDAKKLAYNQVFREFRTWKHYKGGMADDIWIYDFATGKNENITNNIHQDIIPMWIGNEIYFLSDRDWTMNLFVYNIDTKQTTKVTNFNDFDVKFSSAGGKMIVFENGGYIYKYDTEKKKLDKVDIQIEDDAIWARNEFKEGSKYIATACVSPNGERIAFSARGEIFSVPVGKGVTRQLTNTPGVHERNVQWSPDGKYVAYVSDASGENEIYIQNQDGSEPPQRITSNGDTYKFNIEWSPDSKKILWSDQMMRLQYIDISSKKVKLITKSKYNQITNFRWSPDSRWIVFDQQDSNQYSVITVYNTETGINRNVTSSWFDSGYPSFSNDGKYITFVSSRDFTPVYSQTEWNHIYTKMMRVYLIVLSNNTPSPFAPENEEVFQDTSSNKEKTVKKVTTKPEPFKVNIDFDGIEDRILALPIAPSDYFVPECVNDIVYYQERQSGVSICKLYDLKKHEETEMGKIALFRVSSNYKKMLIKEGDRWGVVDMPSGKVTLKDIADVSDMKIWVDYSQEWKQIFDECWRQMRDFFYVSNMNGVDWKKMYKKYLPLVKNVRQRNDLNYVIGEMIAELNSGHAYVNTGEKPSSSKIPVGLLGATISKDASGYFRIDKILKGAGWNSKLRSPLSQIGLKVKEGDYIIAIDGNTVKETSDLYSMLVYRTEKEVQLTINNKPEESGSWKIIVIPTRDESDLYYYNWVQENIKKVNDATNGEVGYIHVPDMSAEGLNEFMKHFYPQLNKKALIIDDRGNGGGNVSPMITERLRRELARSKMARNSPEPTTMPEAMILGPKIMLVDQYSASDGDLFAYDFRRYKLGTIIGRRTWGGVVGISNTLPLIDGTDLRKPEFASYSPDSSTWIIEGLGIEPDIEVYNDPAREYKGIDDQLNKAIEVAKEQLKNYKGLPPIPAAPDKSH
jgi:tricorn protease